MSAASVRRKKRQPPEQEAEVAAGGGEDGVGRTALAVPQVTPAHAVLGFHVADDGLDRGSPSHLAFDPGRDAPFLSGEEDLNL